MDELFEFPPRRFIGNKAPSFVAQRQTLLEVSPVNHIKYDLIP